MDWSVLENIEGQVLPDTMVLGLYTFDTLPFLGKCFITFTEKNTIRASRSVGILLKGRLCLTHLALYYTTLIRRYIYEKYPLALVRFMVGPTGMCYMIIEFRGANYASMCRVIIPNTRFL